MPLLALLTQVVLPALYARFGSADPEPPGAAEPRPAPEPRARHDRARADEPLPAE